MSDVLLPGKQVRAFREYDQKVGWWQPVPSAKAREPYDNEVVKRWWTLSVGLTRKWIANCKPIDRLAISHVLRVKYAGTSMERSRDDE
jgi:hypothetical protein